MREKEIRSAIYGLFDLYLDGKYEDPDDIKEIKEEVGYELESICMAIKNNLDYVYDYQVETSTVHPFRYRGNELFKQRSCKICEELNSGTYTSIKLDYVTELWMLENGTFSIVNCIRIYTDNGDINTEYRTIKKSLIEYDDLFMESEQLKDCLLMMKDYVFGTNLITYHL